MPAKEFLLFAHGFGSVLIGVRARRPGASVYLFADMYLDNVDIRRMVINDVGTSATWTYTRSIHIAVPC